MASILNFTNGPDGDNVYSDWSDPSLELTESGFENSLVLRTTLELLSSHPVGACKYTTGELRTWDETDTRNADGSANITKLSRFIRASAAIPGIFRTVEIDGDVYSDGSTVMGWNVFSAINRCRSAGYAEENIALRPVALLHGMRALVNVAMASAAHATIGGHCAQAETLP